MKPGSACQMAPSTLPRVGHVHALAFMLAPFGSGHTLGGNSQNMGMNKVHNSSALHIMPQEMRIVS